MDSTKGFRLDKPILYAIVLFILVIVGLWIVNYFNISYPVNVKTSQVSSELAVVGEGKVDVVPDSASVDVGVTVENVPTVEEAQEQINTKNNAIIAAVGKLGIPKDQIKTSNYNINPTYQYDGGPQRITGYSGNVTLTIKVKDTNQLSQVITTALEAGANQVYNTQLTVDNPEKYREEARTKAIENAKQQAEELADELGIRLGKVVNIVESSNGGIPPMYYDKALEGRGGGAAPAPDIQPGSQTISSTVTMYFEKR